MEFHEYCQIIRSRMGLPLALALFAVVVATGLFLLAGRQYKAQGQVLALPGAGYTVRWAGSNVEVAEMEDIWGTLQQLVESRAVAEQAALQTRLDVNGLKGFTFDRGRRGNMFSVIGSAGSPQQATAYVAAGMNAAGQLWTQQRLQRAVAVQADLLQRGDQLAPRREALQSRMAQMESGPPEGKPPDVLAWAQSQIASTQGAIATASVDVGMARDRLNSLQSFALRERSVPPQQRLMADGAVLPGPATSLQARLLDLQTQRSVMLQTRTAKHPEVVALDREIADTQKRLAQANDENRPVLNRISPTLQQQLVVAEAELGATQRRVDVLRKQEADLRAKLPVLQSRAREYQALLDQFKPLDDERTALLGQLNTVENEISRLQGTHDLRVVDAATVMGTNKTSKKLIMTIFGSLLGGFIIGTLLVFLLHYLELSRPEYEEAKAAG